MEYAGYVQKGAPDISKAVSGIATELRAVEAGREKRRDNLDKIYAENSELASKTEMGMNPSFNNVMMNFGFDFKNQTYDWHKKLKAGEMSERQFKLGMSNIKSGLNEFHTSVKQKNNRFAEIDKLQRANKLGGRAAYLNEISAEMSTFKDYKPIVGKMGEITMAKIDTNTGKVIEGTVTPVSAMNLEPNVINEKFVVSEKVAPFAKRIGSFVIQDGTVLKKGTSAMESEGLWETAKTDIITSVLNDDTAFADALVDSGGYTYYSEGDGKAVTDKSIKLVRNSDGVMVPEQSEKFDKQKEAARELVSNELDMQVGLSETKATTGKGEDTESDKQGYITNYNLAMDIVEGKNLDTLKARTFPEGTVVDVKRTKNKIIIQIEDKKGMISDKTIDAAPGKEEAAAKAVIALITGDKDIGDSVAKYEKGREYSKRKFKDVSISELTEYKWRENMKLDDEKIDKEEIKGLRSLLEDGVMSAFREGIGIESDIETSKINLESYFVGIGDRIGNPDLINEIDITNDGDKITVTMPNGKDTIDIMANQYKVADDEVTSAADKIDEAINKYVKEYNKENKKTKSTALKTGAIKTWNNKKYRFKGGDPKDKNNWEIIP